MVEKFRHYIDLSREEEKLLCSLEESKKHFKQGDIIRGKNDPTQDLYVMSSGWAYLAVNHDKDVRSIFDIKLNGDFSGITEISFEKSLYDLVALTDVDICPFPKENLQTVFHKSERLCHTFYTILSREQSILYERIASLGRRTALEKIAHFILEVAVRLEMIGHDVRDTFSFPIKQDQMADLMGLSAIHINRSMNELKNNGYISYERGHIKILNKERMFTLSNFNDRFLQTPNIQWQTR